MKHGYKVVRGMVKTCPLPLLSLKEAKLVKYANSLLPVDTGIEIECTMNTEVMESDEFAAESQVMVGATATLDETFEYMARKSIRFLKECKCDGGEQRFRIPAGIEGLICLYDLSGFLKKYSLLNPHSGNHYHIDFTSHMPLVSTPFYLNNSLWPLQALDSWGYKGLYNSRKLGEDNKDCWITTRKRLKTIEFRIGEMTFDYELLIKRILHCQNITKRLKGSIDKQPSRTKNIIAPNGVGARRQQIITVPDHSLRERQAELARLAELTQLAQLARQVAGQVTEARRRDYIVDESDLSSYSLGA